jgi:hypothetical protein
MLPIIVFVIGSTIASNHSETRRIVQTSGCELRISSDYEPYDRDALLWWKVPSRIKYRFLNSGGQDCVIQSKKLMVINPSILRTGEVLGKEAVSQNRPEVRDVDISVGVVNTPTRDTTVQAYAVR